MDLLKKEEKYVDYVLRRIGDIFLIIFFGYLSLHVLGRLYTGDMEATIGNILFGAIFVAVSAVVIYRAIIVLTGRYLSVPVLHKYMSRSEVRQLFENEHFEVPVEFKGTSFEGKVYISEHWLCLYHHFILRHKVGYIWGELRTERGAFPFIVNVLYSAGDTTSFPGDDIEHFDDKREEYDAFWHYLARNIAGGIERTCSDSKNLDDLVNACKKWYPTKEDRKQCLTSPEPLIIDPEQMRELFANIDVGYPLPPKPKQKRSKRKNR